MSRVMTDSTSIKPFWSDIAERDLDRAIDIRRRNERGEALHADHFPTRIWNTKEGQILDSREDLFFAGSYWVVSEKAAAAMRHFDLGGGDLFPVDVLQKDRATRLAGEYFCLNFGNVKNCFLPGESISVFPDPYREAIWRLDSAVGDGDIAVSAAALAGPDIWVDPKLEGAFFLSEALAGAMEAVDAIRSFRLQMCRVLSS